MFKNPIKILFLILGLFSAYFVFARTNVDYWYIKDFETDIIVNKNSSLLITEKILADCGSAIGKHGIFRTLPYQIESTEGIINTPIKLISITDFSNQPLKFSEIRDTRNKTITWKIGDSDVVVSGENEYKITYSVKNAVYKNEESSELYWNALGNFWDLEIDNFKATVYFPNEIKRDEVDIDYYTGELGSKEKKGVDYRWFNDNTLILRSTKTFKEGEGITLSATFPKGILTSSKLSFFEKYEMVYLWFLLPFFLFIILYIVWRKHGRDPSLGKVVTPEYEAPGDLSPMEVGMMTTNGKFRSNFITASIIHFAVSGLIKIEKVKRSFWLGGDDYHLKNQFKEDLINKLSPPERLLFDKIFGFYGDDVPISKLKRSFYTHLPKISKAAVKNLVDKNLMAEAGFKWQKWLVIFGGSIFALTLWVISEFIDLSFFIIIPMLLSFGLVSLFAALMPKRTQKGAEIMWKIKGYKLFMKTAEKHRQEFYERELIFEKHLPYAIAFKMTKLWIKKMEEIYGEEYFVNYRPIWFTGTGLHSFSMGSFVSEINSLSSSIASNVAGPSGAGGVGGAGGGAGGGGGGGW